jgi:hydroxymethylpyrimidine pyrophosphatase-like HAD family hydrolase
MALTQEHNQQLKAFFNRYRFARDGALITDLDGTAIHEYKGEFTFPGEIEMGLKEVYDLGRPIILNTLRFPYSVMRTFGKEWYRVSKRPIPTVLMNGSQLGYIQQDDKGEMYYEEIDAYPLEQEEVKDVIKMVDSLIKDKVTDLLVFFYPRSWKQGEIIWTPLEEKISGVHEKYKSASSVISGPVEKLAERLLQEEICMIFLLIDLPEDKLMAYQHTRKSNFFTHKGVDKESGTRKLAEHLEFSLEHSIGAGDSEMDTFLKAVGLAVHVGNPKLPYHGVLPSILLKDSLELGALLFEIARMQKSTVT